MSFVETGSYPAWWRFFKWGPIWSQVACFGPLTVILGLVAIIGRLFDKEWSRRRALHVSQWEPQQGHLLAGSRASQ